MLSIKVVVAMIALAYETWCMTLVLLHYTQSLQRGFVLG
jgi:hypothetical protein